MRDGFLASMVTQFKKNQSRSSAISSGILSRPASSMSQIAPMNGFTPIPTTSMRMLSQEINSSYEQSYSERSTPSVYNQSRSSSVLPQSTHRSLIAKCQSCNIKGELIICTHCDNVICVKCADEHQSIINNNVKREWDTCKTKFETLSERSSIYLSEKGVFSKDFNEFILVRFEADQEECECKARELQTSIDQQGGKLVDTVNSYKNAYIDLIEKHRRTYKQL
jgi:hypothetical protein